MLLVALLFQAAAPPPPPPCHRQEKRGDLTVWRYLGDRTCVKFEPPRVMEGTWLVDFEASTFYDRSAARDGAHADRGVSWFNPNEPLTPFVSPVSNVVGNGRRMYRVRFVGRKSAPLDPRIFQGFGHLGGARSLVLLDEMLSIEDMGPLHTNYPEPLRRP
jgi:hypothetical protein